MKRIVFLILVIIPLFAIAKKPKNLRLVMKEPVKTETCFFEDWSINVSFEWSEYKNYGVTVYIKNITDSRICVEWENARIDDEQICFGNDNSFTYRDKKPDEVVHSGSQCKRFIARRSEFEVDGRSLFYISNINEYSGSGGRDFIIPIRIGDEVTDYKFTLEVIGDM